MSDRGPILFYDGDCGLCARSVRWCLRHDRAGRLRYAPLQGATYAQLATADKPAQLESMVVVDAAGMHLRGDAVLALLAHVGGVWGVLAAVGRVIPRFVRDAAYRFIAARRLRWFGHARDCPLPRAEWRARFMP
ncbi:MAG: hypothetical protein CHACPFDD_01970 [Phycisphaerae bacterium]|nr:hypothetical protein [Phycisphaerae bacterium]